MVPYIGGKYQQSSWMATLLPKKFDRYGEVFGGAMWFYIKTNFRVKEAYYNDFDPYMYNLFTCFKQYDEMIKKLKDLPALNEDCFKEQKKVLQGNEKFNVPDVDLAVAHVYLVTHIFSGVTGTLRSPKLKMTDKKFKFATMESQAVVKRLRTQDIRRKFDLLQTFNLSYEAFIPEVDGPDLFLYLDPPYYKTESYYKKGDFNYSDHERLATILNNTKCKWMLSYYDYKELDEWYPKDKFVYRRKDYKKLAANAKGKKTPVGTEVLVMNYGKDRDLSKFFEKKE